MRTVLGTSATLALLVGLGVVGGFILGLLLAIVTGALADLRGPARPRIARSR